MIDQKGKGKRRNKCRWTFERPAPALWRRSI